MGLQRERFYLFLIGIVILTLIYMVFSIARLPEYPFKRTLRYSFTVTNPSQEAIESAGFWAYVPLSRTASQQRISIKASHPYQVQQDSDGNERLYFILGTMAPYANKIVSVDVELRTANTQNPISLAGQHDYLKAERYIESDIAPILELSDQLKAWRASSTARNQYDWVASNLNYAGYIADDMGARYALESKSGDCSEYAYLVTALSRAAGYEARVLAGFVVPERSVLEPAGYHNWSEIYYGGTWHLSDAQRGSFDTNQENYIAFRVVSGTTAANTEFGSQKLFGAHLPLSVRMN